MLKYREAHWTIAVFGCVCLPYIPYRKDVVRCYYFIPQLTPCLQGAREVDDARNAASKAEAEAAGLRAALDAARTRHFEQLTK